MPEEPRIKIQPAKTTAGLTDEQVASALAFIVHHWRDPACIRCGHDEYVLEWPVVLEIAHADQRNPGSWQWGDRGKIVSALVCKRCSRVEWLALNLVEQADRAPE